LNLGGACVSQGVYFGTNLSHERWKIAGLATSSKGRVAFCVILDLTLFLLS
jgi:hypothetical protein